MPEGHAGRLFDHVHLRVSDLDASRRFYRDGNNIEAVFHGPAERSAESIVFRWDEA